MHGKSRRRIPPASGCRKSGLRHFFEVFIAPLRLRRGQGAMQGNPCYARLFADLTRMSPNPIKASGGCGPRTPGGFSTGWRNAAPQGGRRCVGAAGGTRTPKVSPADFKSAVYANSTTAAQVSLYGLWRIPSTPVIGLTKKFLCILRGRAAIFRQNGGMAKAFAKVWQFA